MSAPLPPLEFRAFDPSDAVLLDRWLREAELGMPEGMSISDWRDRALLDDRILLEVALDDGGEAMGFLRMDIAPDRSAELTLITDPDARRRGIGSQLLGRVLVLARGMALTRLLAAVQVDNPGARAFFLARGFEPTDAPTREYEHMQRVVHGADRQPPLEIVP